MQKLIFLGSPHLLGQGSVREKTFSMHPMTSRPRFIFKWKGKRTGELSSENKSVFPSDCVTCGQVLRCLRIAQLCAFVFKIRFYCISFAISFMAALQLSAHPSHFHS